MFSQNMKVKKAEIVLHGFTEVVNKSKHGPNKVWVDKGKEFHNSPMQKWLDDNDILMYSTHIESKSVVSGRFIRTLKNKIYKTMIANNKKSYLAFLNTHLCSISKNPLKLIILLWLKK